MLATWLCVLYLNKLIEVEEVRLPPNHARLLIYSDLFYKAKKDLEPIRSEFHQFLRDYQDRLDTKTTFHLLASHGRIKGSCFLPHSGSPVPCLLLVSPVILHPILRPHRRRQDVWILSDTQGWFPEKVLQGWWRLHSKKKLRGTPGSFAATENYISKGFLG